MINYGELLAVLLLLLAAPLAYVNWLLGGYTASLVGCYKLWRQGAYAERRVSYALYYCAKQCLSVVVGKLHLSRWSFTTATRDSFKKNFKCNYLLCSLLVVLVWL